jgi:hypothetical protein
MAGDNGSAPLNSNMIFRGLVIGMFGIIVALIGYTAQNMASRVDDLSHRFDREADRLNALAERTVKLETEIMDRPGLRGPAN